MKKQYLLGSFIISALLVPVLASAATADEIRAQIQSLLSQITALQAQLTNLTTDTSVTTTANVSCPNLYRTLSRGSRGSDVISLQQFLIAQGHLSGDSATGFFGAMTESAVQRWQAQNSIVASGDANTTGYGVVGARTRAAVAVRCGVVTQTSENAANVVSESTTRFSAAPTLGAAPLLVQFLVTGRTEATAIDFGDGKNEPLVKQCYGGGYGDTGCMLVAHHTYLVAGSYAATLYRELAVGAPCQPGGTCPTNGRQNYGTAIITVQNAQKEQLKSCVFNGAIVQHGASVTAYQSAAASLGEMCSSQVRTCSNGVLSGSHAYAGCSVVPAPGFTATPITGTAPLAVSFSGNVSSGATAVDFGDGQVGTMQQVCSNASCTLFASHQYVSAGSYTAHLLKTQGNATQTLGSLTISVTSAQTDNASFSATPMTGPAPLSVSFNAEKSTGATAVSFGDGNVGALQEVCSNYSCTLFVAHQYAAVGTYTTSLLKAQGNATQEIASITITVSGAAQNASSGAQGSSSSGSTSVGI